MTTLDTATSSPIEPAAAEKKPRRGAKSLPIAREINHDLPPRAAERYEPELSLELIDPSPHNHRKNFTHLEELAESIKLKGVVSPISVRPSPTTPGRFELIAGERRWRSSGIAGRATIPALVKDLSDVEVLEEQLIENVQREDVHPLEEAQGYRDLCDKHGYTIDLIIEKTGKSKAWVYARLKLCELSPEARELFLSEKLNASIALLIARIPDPKLQARAIREVLCLEPDGEGSADTRYDDFYDRPHVDVEDDKGVVTREIVPMSVREAAAHIHKNYMLKLEQAKFDTTDERLVPEAGACGRCPHRTGNQADLFGDVKRGDVCTNPPCFEAKTQAAFERAAATAAAQGAKVLTVDESKKLFISPHDPTSVRHNAPFVAASDLVPWEVAQLLSEKERAAGGSLTWGKLLGKKGVNEVDKVVAQDGTGAARELLSKAKVIEQLTEAGKLNQPTPASKSPAVSAADEKAKRERALVKSTFAKVFEASGHISIAKLSQKSQLELWRWVVLKFADIVSDRDDGMPFVLQALGISDGEEFDYPGSKEIEDAVAKIKTAADLQLVLVRFALAEHAPFRELDDSGVHGLKLLGVDWKTLLAKERAAVASNVAIAKSAAKKKPAGKAKATSLADLCDKCGRELGEHTGKKCPKPAKAAGKGR